MTQTLPVYALMDETVSNLSLTAHLGYSLNVTDIAGLRLQVQTDVRATFQYNMDGQGWVKISNREITDILEPTSQVLVTCDYPAVLTITSYTPNDNIQVGDFDLPGLGDGNSNSGGDPPVVPVVLASDYTFASGDDGKVFDLPAGLAITVTVPSGLGWKVGALIRPAQTGSATLHPTSGQTINGSTSDIVVNILTNPMNAFLAATQVSNNFGLSIGGTSFAGLADDPRANTTLAGYLDAKVATSTVAQPNGVASLDNTGKIPISQIPSTVTGTLLYKGTWNASTNSPTLASGVGTNGWYYTVSVAGTTSIDGTASWAVGDHIIFNGTVWQKVAAPAADVVSVAGKQGVVSLVVGDVSGAAPLDSATLTGTPSSTTPAANDNTTRIATTAWVAGQLASATPLMNGTGAVGTSPKVARQDHVHPSDTAKAGTSQTGGMGGYVAAVTDGVVYVGRCLYAFTLSDGYYKTTGGSTSLQVKKNGTNVGSANTANTTENHVTFAAVAFAAGDYLEVDAASSSSCTGLQLTLSGTRTLS
jgi:hypothetical protein